MIAATLDLHRQSSEHIGLSPGRNSGMQNSQKSVNSAQSIDRVEGKAMQIKPVDRKQIQSNFN